MSITSQLDLVTSKGKARSGARKGSYVKHRDLIFVSSKVKRQTSEQREKDDEPEIFLGGLGGGRAVQNSRGKVRN